MYYLKMMGGEKFLITDEEAKQTMVAKEKVFINSVKSWINMSSVSAIYPEHKADETEDRKKQEIGILHDGSKVKRYFGQWVDADNMAVDDNGKYTPIRIDPKYYPEVAMDCVPTEREWEFIKNLPPSERLDKILERHEPKKLSEGMQSIKELL